MKRSLRRIRWWAPAAFVLLACASCWDIDPTDLEVRCTNSEFFDDDMYTVGVKFRVEVVDAQAFPVEGANVRVEFYKVHCEGDHSQHFIEEGLTGDNGVFSTELAVVYNTFLIDNQEDIIVVEARAWKEAWTENDPRTFEQGYLFRLPQRADGSGERRLVPVFEFEYSP